MIPSRTQESQSEFLRSRNSKQGGGKARTSVQLGQKLKHPRVEFEAINSSRLVALILKK